MACWNKLRNHPKWLDKMKEISEQKNNKKKKTAADSSPEDMASPVEGENSNPESDTAKKRPMGNKKAKECSRRGGGDASREAVDHFWEKKKEADAQKELKKEERFKLAFKLEEERLRLKRTLEEDGL